MAGLGGLYRTQPVFSALAMVPIFSLAGVPPLSGFLGKLAILEGTFEAGAYWVGGMVLVVGLLTLLSMGRTWADAFWRPAATERDMATPGTPLLIAISGLSLVTLAINVRRRTALRAHVTRRASTAAAGRVHPGGAGRTP